MEAERYELRHGYEATYAQYHLREGVRERSEEVGLLVPAAAATAAPPPPSSRRLARTSPAAAAGCAEHRDPQLQAVDVLPAAHDRPALRCLLRHRAPQVQCQLPDVHERVLIRARVVEAVQLHDAVPHEREGRQHARDVRRRAELGPPGVPEVGRLEAVLDEGVRLGDRQLPHSEERLQAHGVVTLGRVEGRRPEADARAEGGACEAGVRRQVRHVPGEGPEDETEQFGLLPRLRKEVQCGFQERFDHGTQGRPVGRFSERLGMQGLVLVEGDVFPLRRSVLLLRRLLPLLLLLRSSSSSSSFFLSVLVTATIIGIVVVVVVVLPPLPRGQEVTMKLLVTPDEANRHEPIEDGGTRDLEFPPLLLLPPLPPDAPSSCSLATVPLPPPLVVVVAVAVLPILPVGVAQSARGPERGHDAPETPDGGSSPGG